MVGRRTPQLQTHADGVRVSIAPMPCVPRWSGRWTRSVTATTTAGANPLHDALGSDVLHAYHFAKCALLHRLAAQAQLQRAGMERHRHRRIAVDDHRLHEVLVAQDGSGAHRRAADAPGDQLRIGGSFVSHRIAVAALDRNIFGAHGVAALDRSRQDRHGDGLHVAAGDACGDAARAGRRQRPGETPRARVDDEVAYGWRLAHARRERDARQGLDRTRPADRRDRRPTRSPMARDSAPLISSRVAARPARLMTICVTPRASTCGSSCIARRGERAQRLNRSGLARRWSAEQLRDREGRRNVRRDRRGESTTSPSTTASRERSAADGCCASALDATRRGGDRRSESERRACVRHGEPRQPRNIWVVADSIWSVAVMTLAFIS